MDRQVQLADNVRHQFRGPIEMRWINAEGTGSYVSGTSIDASVYGLGIVLPVHIPVNTEVTVLLHRIAICGAAKVRYSQECPSGFKTGVKFEQALFMQNIPGLDEILMGSFYSRNNGAKPKRASLMYRLRLRLSRALIPKSG